MNISSPIKTILFYFLIGLNLFNIPGALATDQLTAHQIMQNVDQRDNGNSVVSETTMILIDKNGNQRVRQLKIFSKDYGKDTKGISFFMSPADVRNTAYMTFNWDDENKDDDSWLYLPALQKVKRISSDDKAGSFMGSDFTYADINGMEISDWNYVILKPSDTVDGKDTWIIQGKPKTEKKADVIKETGYLKMHIWVRKDIFMIVKAKYWIKKGKKIKHFKAENIRKIDGIDTATKLNMVTTQRGKQIHASVIQYSSVAYNTDIADDLFTTQRMTRGL